MARLEEDEKQELLRGAAELAREQRELRAAGRLPARPRLTLAEYIEFATSVSSFARPRKPVRFVGDNWKL